MATITRKQAEELFSEIIEVKVKSEVEKRLKEEMAKVNEELDRRLKEGTLEANMKREVDKQVKGSMQTLQASLDEGHKLYQRMALILQKYAEEVPLAERMCETLSRQLATPGQPQSAGDAAGNSSAGPTWYRNIKYPDSSAAFNALRMDVRNAPSTTAPRQGSLEFGALLPVAGTQLVGQSLWLQLAQGATSSGQDLQGFWVRATLDDGTIECAEVKGEGRPEPTEYIGQTFGRFYTEGFDGPRDAVVLSASGHAFWPMLNLTCMLRGIAMATVFEQDWADSSEGFAVWVPYYAVNVYRFGLAGRKKHKFVTVKPTANWRRYAGPQGTSVPNAENVKGDIGRAQFCECQWLCGMSRKLGFEWADVTFITALSFLRVEGKWSEEQCIEECLLELERTHKDFQTLDDEAEMERLFFAQLFSTEEALGFADLQAELGVAPADHRVARDPENPVPWPTQPIPKPEQAARARDLLRDMLRLWTGSKESFRKSLQELHLEPADLTDLGILTNGDRNVLHAVARTGNRRILSTVLHELRQAKVLRDWLIRPDHQGQTPLHVALGACQRDATAILLEELSDSKQLGRVLEMIDKDGQSLMHLALSAGDEEAMKAFLNTWDTSKVPCDLLTRRSANGKSPLDLCQHQESVLMAVLSVGIRTREVRKWVVQQFNGVRTPTDAGRTDCLGRLLHQQDVQGQRLITAFYGDERTEVLHEVAAAGIRSDSLHSFHHLFCETAKANDKALTEVLLEVAEDRKVLQALALHAPTEGLSRLLDHGVRKPNATIVAKVLDRSRTEGRLQEVLHDLVVNGTQDALSELLRQSLATTTLAGWFRRTPAVFELQEALDDALLGQMLGTLHAGGHLVSSLEAPSASSSPERWSRLLRAVFVVEDRPILGELLDTLLLAVGETGYLQQVLQNLVVHGTKDALNELLKFSLGHFPAVFQLQQALDSALLGQMLKKLHAEDSLCSALTVLSSSTSPELWSRLLCSQCWDRAIPVLLLRKLMQVAKSKNQMEKVFTCTSRSAPIRILSILLGALVDPEMEGMKLWVRTGAFVRALQATGHLQEVFTCTARTASLGTLNILLGVLVDRKIGRNSLWEGSEAFVKAVQTTGRLLEVLQNLVVHGTKDALNELPKFSLGHLPAAFQLQQALDSALLGQMLEKLHAEDSLCSALTVLSSSTSPGLWSRLLCSQCRDRAIPVLLLRKLMQVAKSENQMEQVFTCTSRSASIDVLSILLGALVDPEMEGMELWVRTGAFVRALQATGHLQEVFTCTAGTASLGTLNILLGVLVDRKIRWNSLWERSKAFVKAVQTAGRLQEVFACIARSASAGTLSSILLDVVVDLEPGSRMLRLARGVFGPSYLQPFVAAVGAAGRLQEVVQTSSRSQLRNVVKKLLLGGHQDMARLVASLYTTLHLQEVLRYRAVFALGRKGAWNEEKLNHVLADRAAAILNEAERLCEASSLSLHILKARLRRPPADACDTPSASSMSERASAEFGAPSLLPSGPP